VGAAVHSSATGGAFAAGHASASQVCNVSMSCLKEICRLRMKHPDFNVSNWQWPEIKHVQSWLSSNRTRRSTMPSVQSFDEPFAYVRLAIKNALIGVDAYERVKHGDIVSPMVRQSVTTNLMQQSHFAAFMLREEHILRWLQFAHITRTQFQGAVGVDAYAVDGSMHHDEIEQLMYGRFEEFVRMRDKTCPPGPSYGGPAAGSERFQALFPVRFTKTRAAELLEAHRRLIEDQNFPGKLDTSTKLQMLACQRERLALGAEIGDLQWPFLPGESLEHTKTPEEQWLKDRCYGCHEVRNPLECNGELLPLKVHSRDQLTACSEAKKKGQHAVEIPDVGYNGDKLGSRFWICTSKPRFRAAKEGYACTPELQFGHQRTSPEFRAMVQSWVSLTLGCMTELFTKPRGFGEEDLGSPMEVSEDLKIEMTKEEVIQKEAKEASKEYLQTVNRWSSMLLSVMGLQRASMMYESMAAASKAAGIRAMVAVVSCDTLMVRDTSIMPNKVTEYIDGVDGVLTLQTGENAVEAEIRQSIKQLKRASPDSETTEKLAELEAVLVKCVDSNELQPSCDFFEAVKKLIELKANIERPNGVDHWRVRNRDTSNKPMELLQAVMSNICKASPDTMSKHSRKLLSSVFHSIVAPLISTGDHDSRTEAGLSADRRSVYKRMFKVLDGTVEDVNDLHEHFPYHVITPNTKDGGETFLEDMLQIQTLTKLPASEDGSTVETSPFWTATAEKLMNNPSGESAALCSALAEMLQLLDFLLNRDDRSALNHLLPRADCAESSASWLVMDYLGLHRTPAELDLPRGEAEAQMAQAQGLIIQACNLMCLVSNAYDPQDRLDKAKMLHGKVMKEGKVEENPIGICHFVKELCGETYVPIITVMANLLTENTVSKQTARGLTAVLCPPDLPEGLTPLINPAELDAARAFIHGMFLLCEDNADIMEFRHCALALGNFDQKIVAIIHNVMQGLGGSASEDESDSHVAEEDFLAKIFAQFDADKSSTIDFDEFTEMLRYVNVNISQEKAVQIFSMVDIDGSKELSFDEFERGFELLAKEVVHTTLKNLGISDIQIYATVGSGMVSLMGVFTFLFLGMAAFTENSTFGSVVNSSFALTAGLVQGVQDNVHIDADDPKIQDHLAEKVEEALEELNPQ